MTCECSGVCWHQYHLIGPEEAVEQRARIEQHNEDERVTVLTLGESHLSLIDVPGHPGEVYLFNTYTPPESRGQGGLRRLMDDLYERADGLGVTLVTHPADPWLRGRLERRGWTVVPDRPEAFGSPLYQRLPGAGENGSRQD